VSERTGVLKIYSSFVKFQEKGNAKNPNTLAIRETNEGREQTIQ